MDNRSVSAMAEVEPWNCQPQGYILPQPGRGGGEWTGLTRDLWRLCSRAQGLVKGSKSPGQQKLVPFSGKHSHFTPSSSMWCWGGEERASFWRSPWQLDLVASPQKMVCFQAPGTSWQQGAQPKTTICCCQGTRNRRLSAANNGVSTQLAIPLGLARLAGCKSTGVLGSWGRHSWGRHMGFPW